MDDTQVARTPLWIFSAPRLGPTVRSSAKVTGEVVAERRGAKVLVVKFKRRKNYRRHRGHRQTMTAVRITKIEV